MDSQQMRLGRLMNHEERRTRTLNEELVSACNRMLTTLADHFRRQLSEEERLTYLNGLCDLPIARLETAGIKALRTCKKMPVLAELLEFANERIELVVTASAPSTCGRCVAGYVHVDCGPIPGLEHRPKARYRKVRPCECIRRAA